MQYNMCAVVIIAPCQTVCSKGLGWVSYLTDLSGPIVIQIYLPELNWVERFVNRLAPNDDDKCSDDDECGDDDAS